MFRKNERGLSMAGHSKWANIKHRKEKSDQKKGKEFSRLAKEIISAVKQGGSDPKTNVKLARAIEKAKEANFPSENVERNIKKASNPDQSDFSEMTYELYGYGGAGIIVDVMTDNKNRIASEIRIATNKCGGTIATPGSVSYNFERKGVLEVLKKHALEDELFLLVSDAGAEDFEVADDRFMITTAPENLNKVKEALEKKQIVCDSASLEMIPKNFVECSKEDLAQNMKLIEWLERLDDVDAVYHNINYSSSKGED
jgi:YebC/PmpR family DNA-binding regulatory protein